MSMLSVFTQFTKLFLQVYFNLSKGGKWNLNLYAKRGQYSFLFSKTIIKYKTIYPKFHFRVTFFGDCEWHPARQAWLSRAPLLVPLTNVSVFECQTSRSRTEDRQPQQPKLVERRWCWKSRLRGGTQWKDRQLYPTVTNDRVTSKFLSNVNIRRHLINSFKMLSC